MKMLSLFSGVGMIDLSGQWAGIETVAMCEIEPYAVSVLERRFPNVPIYNDVRTLTKGKLKENGIDKEEFEIAKKSIYGDTVASLNSVDTISNILADYHFKGNNMFDYIDEIANATIEDVTKRLDCMLDVNNCTLSVVKPIQDGEK